MTSKTSEERIRNSSQPSQNFLDTSVAIKLCFGHSAHQEYLRAAISPPRYVNGYVRMEYYRFLVTAIHLYHEAGETFHKSFSNAINFMSEQFGREPKRVLIVVSKFLETNRFNLGDPGEKEICRQKLQDLIFELALIFEEVHTDTGHDPTRCKRVPAPLRLSGSGVRDRALLDFERNYNDVKACRATCSIAGFFTSGKYGSQLTRLQAASAAQGAAPEFQSQAQWLSQHQGKPEGITCNTCSKVGDAIIAVSVPRRWTLHSLDRRHQFICQAIGKAVQIQPSAASLKSRK